MIAFSCPHCGAPLKVKESMAGTAGPCPGCSRVVKAPEASSAPGSGSSAAGQTSGVRKSSHATLRLPAAADDTATVLPPPAPPPEYPFLAPPRGPNELGWLAHYRVLEVLGTGAMGVVFEAEDTHLQRHIALKVMKPSLAASAEFQRRFLREARLAAAVEHEHVVPIYQVGEDRGVPFLAMRLLQGETLEDRLRQPGTRLEPAEVMRVGREIAEGLAEAHARGLIHRDVKPANIWLEAGRDKVKLVDFGLARGSTADAHFTQPGAVIGTPFYMAPEQAEGEEVDARCDLFSLGAVLYRAATGARPFEGRDTLTVLKALATKTPQPPHEIVPALPRPFSDLLMRLLAKDPKERPQSARDVVSAIEAIERGETSEAPPAPPPEEPPPPPAPKVEEAPPPPSRSGVKRKRPRKGPRRKKRHESETDRGRLVLVGALVLLGVAVLVLVIGLIHRARSKPRAAAPNVVVVRLEGQSSLSVGFTSRSSGTRSSRPETWKGMPAT